MSYRYKILVPILFILATVSLYLFKSDNTLAAGRSYLVHENVQYHSQKSNSFYSIIPNLLRRDSKSRINNFSVSFYDKKIGSIPEDVYYFSFTGIFFNSFYSEKANLRAPPAAA